jgi:competence protein ComEA
MFGRRTTPDPDAVAAAQRRLAALAAQFDSRPVPAEGLPGTATGTDADTRLPAQGLAPDVEAAPDARPARQQDPRDLEPGKHATRRASALRARWVLTPEQVAVIALVAVAAVLVAAWWVLRSIPHSEPVQLSSQRSVPGPTTTSAPVTANPAPGQAGSGVTSQAPAQPGPATSTVPPGGDIVVDVAGKVRSPGIVELPAGSRVVDALDAAGGPRSGVDTRSLNLARPLVDGEQLVVGYPVPVVAGTPTVAGTTLPSSTSGAVQRLNLNTATAEQLDTLPDIGPVTAQSILTWREENGSFTSVDELLEVSGIGDATLADVAPYVYV